MGVRTWSRSRSSRLRNAMKKVTGLINHKKIRWLLALHLRRRSLEMPRRRPFEYLPALTACAADDGNSETTTHGASRLRSRLTSASGCISDYDDDVDKRAEAFIADFYRQLRLERQVSLEREGSGFESTDETGSSF